MSAADFWVIARCLLALSCLAPAACGGAQARDGAVLRPAHFLWRQEADLAGTYLGHAPAKDAARRVFTLDLAADGTATLTTLYIGRDDAKQYGRWTRSGSQIVLTFDAMGSNRPPGAITFRHRDHELSPLRWDTSEWGRSGPPVLHRARSRAVQGGL
jgi:hypothetical protein